MTAGLGGMSGAQAKEFFNIFIDFKLKIMTKKFAVLQCGSEFEPQT